LNNILFDELSETLNKFNLHKKNVCLIGGTSLYINNIRPHRDIDLIILDVDKQKLLEQLGKNQIKSRGEITLSKNVEVNKGKVFKKVNISDNELINNPSYHQIYKDYKVAKLELVYSKKIYRCGNIKSFRLKDLYDVYLINKYFNNHKNFDSSLMLYQDINIYGKLSYKIIIFLSKIYGKMPKKINKYKIPDALQ
jgi:hypothetical protein